MDDNSIKKNNQTSFICAMEEMTSRQYADMIQDLPFPVRHTWSGLSNINYMPSLGTTAEGESITCHDVVDTEKKISSQKFISPQTSIEEDLLEEQFPKHVTKLMNEDQLWGCFYLFPEIYTDACSPTVQVTKPEDIPNIMQGVLTQEIVAACLTYLKRSPILGDFVYIKLDLSLKLLTNIDVLKDYKFLVYLNLSSNLLSDLSVLSNLPYLQYLSVAFNRLANVLDYDNAQWFLSEVHYGYNSVKSIRDLTSFWSITVLDLSHNNIKFISGLENLRYLRRLDLSFNHIKRLENLNHLPLLWLDVSYNNISTFEFNDNTGLWTLLDLEYLNINENNLTCMQVFLGCSRLRELYARNNRLGVLLELAVYMRQLRRITVLDLRSNPVCATPGYKQVVINTFPLLVNLDSESINPIEQKMLKMEMTMDLMTFSTRRLLHLLYLEQLSRACVSPYTPPADTTEVPIIIIVGYEAVGKGTLARRLAKECNSNIELALQHTTASHHFSDHYKQISRQKFDDMILAGEFLTYSEANGESYGLSREEAFVRDGKVRLATMDLIGALMLKLRGRRPYLILATYSDKLELSKKQNMRKEARYNNIDQQTSVLLPQEISSLQILLSDRIIITGLLNEIILSLPEPKSGDEFTLESECSLMIDSKTRPKEHKPSKRTNRLELMTLSSSSYKSYCRENKRNSQTGMNSLYSLYKASQGNEEFISQVNDQPFYEEDAKKADDHQTQNKNPKLSSTYKSVDFTKFTSSTWKGITVAQGSMKSSKSVTFTAQENAVFTESDPMDPSGLIIEPQPELYANGEEMRSGRSISMKLCSYLKPRIAAQDSDLWLAFLIEAGLVQASEIVLEPSDTMHIGNQVNDSDFIIRQIKDIEYPSESLTIRDDYEHIHRQMPGLFWDTVIMDQPDNAFKKVKQVIRNIINSQKNMKPMFDIDFINMADHPIIQKKVANICNDIAPHRLFN